MKNIAGDIYKLIHPIARKTVPNNPFEAFRSAIGMIRHHLHEEYEVHIMVNEMAKEIDKMILKEIFERSDGKRRSPLHGYQNGSWPH